ncbi:MAG: hypothetical protein JG774_609 [Desulfomicrobiaceae bacterium]|jgi:hypothetical protein|nr:hypothetical protein [Desulfomicrobiaceae bacterium]
MRAKRVGIAWGVVVLLWTMAWAQGSLTGGQVERFLQVYEELKPVFDTMEVEDTPAEESPAALAMQWGKTVTQDAKAQAVLAKHGLDAASWTDLASRVMTTYMVLKMSEGGDSPLVQLRQSLAELEKDTSIPASMKPEIVANLQQAIVQYEDMEKMVSPEDKAAVRPLLPRLDTALEWTDQ